jgi:hypothetical protein
MPQVLKAQIRGFLHDYKKRVFELDHEPKHLEHRKEAITRFVSQVLDEKARFHFHQKIDKAQIDTLDLIYDFCHEAMLPPIIGRLAERILTLEARQQAALDLAQKVLDALAQDEKS